MIPVNEPLLDDNEAKYLAECIDTGWISSEGPFVQRLEEGMAAVAGQRYGIAVMNGSVALDVAVAALRIGAGDEVILPTFTIISCAAAVIRAGGYPGGGGLRAAHLEHGCAPDRIAGHPAHQGDTGDEALAQRCRDLRNLCFGRPHRFAHEELGWNFLMSNLQAAVGVAQMERLPRTLERKRRIGRWYDELLADIPALERLPARTGYAENIHWVYGLVLADTVPFDAGEAMQRLAASGIGTRPFFWPMHEQPVLRRMGLFDGISCPVAERIARRGFYIPSGVAHSSLTHGQFLSLSFQYSWFSSAISAVTLPAGCRREW